VLSAYPNDSDVVSPGIIFVTSFMNDNFFNFIFGSSIIQINCSSQNRDARCRRTGKFDRNVYRDA
jgi:hypothetical protein